MSATTATTVREDITAARQLTAERLDAVRAGLPALDIEKASLLLPAFREEVSTRSSRVESALNGTLASREVQDLIREGIALDRARLDPSTELITLPAHQKLSEILDQAIVAAVRQDKKLLRGVYREVLAEEDFPMGALLRPAINGVLNIQFFRGPEKLMETLVKIGATWQVELRAKLCAKILKRMTNAD